MRNGEPWIGKRPRQPSRGARPGAVPAAGRGRPQTAMRCVAAQQPGPPQAWAPCRLPSSLLPSRSLSLLHPAAAPRAPRSPPGRSAPPPGRPEAAPARGHAAQAALPLLPAPVPHRRPARSRWRREAVALTWRAARRAGVPASPPPRAPRGSRIRRGRCRSRRRDAAPQPLPHRGQDGGRPSRRQRRLTSPRRARAPPLAPPLT